MAVTTAIVGATVGSALIGARGARKAGEAQAAGQQAGIGEQRRQFDITQEQLEPFRAGGVSAFDLQLAQSGALGPEEQAQAFQQFQESPGQAFLRERGERSILRTAAARGGLGGANVQKELVQFGQGVAAQDFGNQFSRLGSLSRAGLSAAGGLGQIGAQTSGNISNLLAGQGTSQAQGILGGTQAIQSGLSGLGGLLGAGTAGQAPAIPNPTAAQQEFFFPSV